MDYRQEKFRLVTCSELKLLIKCSQENEEDKLLLGLLLHRIIIRLFWYIIRYYLEAYSWNPILCAVLITLLNMTEIVKYSKGHKVAGM